MFVNNTETRRKPGFPGIFLLLCFLEDFALAGLRVVFLILKLALYLLAVLAGEIDRV